MPTLDDYEPVRVLASGGMGVVHEAIERATGRRVALKRILTGALDGDAMARFLVEGRALARLDHAAIVRVHALEQAPGGPFMVMELVPGESLERVLARDGPLAPGRAAAIALALADALEHAHQSGVLHRDLKPANVLVTPEGQVKLIDFGLARLQVDGGSLDHLTRTGEMLGTPGFMAPEQVDGRPVDARTDVYGLGAALYALLTGRPPFEGINAIAVLEGVLTQAPLAPSRVKPGVPRALDEVVLACLAKDPAARPQSMGALRERLVADRAPRRARRRPARAPAVAAFVAVVGATVPAAWWAARRSARDVGGAPATDAPAASSTTAAVDTRRAAIEAAERAVGARPDDPEAWLDLARERARQGDLTGALTPPASDAPRAARLAHARALLSAGRVDEARSVAPAGDDRDLVLLRFEVVVALRASAGRPLVEALELPEVVALAGRVGQDPRWVDGLFERERFLVLLQPEAARTESAAEALRTLGADALAERLLALAAWRDDMRAALRHVDAAIARSPAPSAPLHELRGRVLSNLGRLDEADAELTRTVELDPLSLEAWRARGAVRERQGRLRAAAADAAQVVALLGPAASQELRLRSAELLLQGGHHEEALRALDGVPASAGLLRQRGDVLRAMGDVAGATRAYEQVLEGRLPGPPGDFERAGQALGLPELRWREAYFNSLEGTADPTVWTQAAQSVRADAPQLAEVFVTRAIERGAGAEAYSLRAAIRTQLGRFLEAIADDDQTLALAPAGGARVTALRNRAFAREAIGDLLGALQDVKATQRLVPEREAPRLALERERLERELGALAEAAAAATLAYKGTALARQALERLQAATSYRAESPRFRLLLAWTLRAIARAVPQQRNLIDEATRLLGEVERERALTGQARALRRRLEQDEVDLRRVAADDPAERIQGLLALRRYPEADAALRALGGHPRALELGQELARCLREAGDLENARAWYGRYPVDEGTDAWAEAALGVAEVAHDAGQTTAGILRTLEDLSRRPGPRAGRAGVERARALLVRGRADEALEAAGGAQAHTEAALASTPADDERARDPLNARLAEAALVRGRALLRLGRRDEARDALLGAAFLAATLSLDEHLRVKAEVRREALSAFDDDDEVVRAASLAFP